MLMEHTTDHSGVLEVSAQKQSPADAAACVQWVRMLELALEQRGPMEKNEDHDGLESGHELLLPIHKDTGLLSGLGLPEALLFEAIESDSSMGIRAALKQGANVNAQDAEGRTPVMLAILRGHRNSLGLLMDHGIDHNVRDQQGRTVFDYFPKFSVLSHERLARTSCVVSVLSIESALEARFQRP